MNRREFLGVCGLTAVAAACGTDAVARTARTVLGTSTGPAARRGVGSAVPAVGQLLQAAFDFVPPGTLACDGALASVDQWPELATLLGTTYGGDGSAMFGLPNLAPGNGVRWLIGGTGRSFASGQAALLGEVRPMIVQPPEGSPLANAWLLCDGRRFPAKGNEALYSLLDMTFGGDLRSNFGIPHLPPLGGRLSWWISVAGDFPGMACDAATPTFPSDAPLDAYVGTVTHLAYQRSQAEQVCGVALCRGQVLPLEPWTELSTLIGNRFGGDLRKDTFALPKLPALIGNDVIPAIVVTGTYPERT